MSDSYALGAIIAFTSSLLLIIYSGHAHAKGFPQGTFFASGKAMIMGYVGAAASVGLALNNGSYWELLIIAALSFFLATPLLLGWLRSSTQIVSVIGLPVGLGIMLVAKG